MDIKLFNLKIVSEKRLIVKVKRHANVSQETLASLSKQKPLKGRAQDIRWLFCFLWVGCRTCNRVAVGLATEWLQDLQQGGCRFCNRVAVELATGWL